MQTVFIVLILAKLLSFTKVSCHEEDEFVATDFLSIDRSKYVNPHDMFNYKRPVEYDSKPLEAKQKETRIAIENAPEIEETTENNENHQVLEELVTTATVSPLETKCVSVTKPESCPCLENKTCLPKDRPFLRRFARILSRTLQLQVILLLLFKKFPVVKEFFVTG